MGTFWNHKAIHRVAGVKSRECDVQSGAIGHLQYEIHDSKELLDYRDVKTGDHHYMGSVSRVPDYFSTVFS